MTANGVLDQLRDTGTVLYAATLVGPAGTADAPTPDMAHLETREEVERDRVLNDGTRQSGGLIVSSLRTDDFPAALDRIRGELLHQYDRDVRPSRRIEVGWTREYHDDPKRGDASGPNPGAEDLDCRTGAAGHDSARYLTVQPDRRTSDAQKLYFSANCMMRGSPTRVGHAARSSRCRPIARSGWPSSRGRTG